LTAGILAQQLAAAARGGGLEDQRVPDREPMQAVQVDRGQDQRRVDPDDAEAGQRLDLDARRPPACRACAWWR
jgi:hypothetical protein